MWYLDLCTNCRNSGGVSGGGERLCQDWKGSRAAELKGEIRETHARSLPPTWQTVQTGSKENKDFVRSN